MAKRNIDIIPPIGGVVRRSAFQFQAPYTCYNAQNVRSFDDTEDRERVGSRQGVVKHFPSQMANVPVNMLDSVQSRTSAATASTLAINFPRGTFDTDTWTDVFGYEGGVDGRPEDGGELVSGVPVAGSGTLAFYNYRDIEGNVQRAANYKAKPFDSSSSFSASLIFDTQSGPTSASQPLHHNQILYLYLLTDSLQAGGTSNGIRVQVRRNTQIDQWSAIAQFYDGMHGSEQINGPSYGATVADGVAKIFRVHFTSVTGTMTVSLNGTELLSTNLSNHSFSVGDRFGFGFQSSSFQTSDDTDYGSIWAEQLALYTSPATPEGGTRVVVAACNGIAYKSENNDMTPVANDATSGTAGIASDRDIRAVEYGGKLYIADYDNVSRSAKVYDPTTDTLSDWNPSGGSSVWQGQYPLITRWDGRCVVGGRFNEAHIWHMSAQGGDLELAEVWNPNPTVALSVSPVSASSTELEVIGDPLVALIPALDDYLLFSTADGMFIMRGNPRFGGTLDRISRSRGVATADAWTWPQIGMLLFLGDDGLYSQVGDRPPEPVSSETLPNDLRNLSSTDQCYIAYDADNRAVYIFTRTASGNQHWLFDMRRGAFWPLHLRKELQPSRVAEMYDSAVRGRVALMGTDTGYINRFSRFVSKDDGETYRSFVDIGPLRVGGSGRNDGIVTSMIATLGLNSADTTWRLISGEYAEEAAKANSFQGYLQDGNGENITDGKGNALTVGAFGHSRGGWTAGRNLTDHPSVRAGAAVLRVENIDEETTGWSLESVNMEIEITGKQVLR